MGNITFQIRQAKAVDIEALVRLLGCLFEIEEDFSFEPEKQKRGLKMLLNRKDVSCVFVAEHSTDKTILGMCSVQTLISTAEGGLSALIEDVVVSPDCRGEGIGRKLLQSAEKWAMENNITRCQLLYDRTNHKALGFYKSCRWSETRLVCLRKMF